MAKVDMLGKGEDDADVRQLLNLRPKILIEAPDPESSCRNGPSITLERAAARAQSNMRCGTAYIVQPSPQTPKIRTSRL